MGPKQPRTLRKVFGSARIETLWFCESFSQMFLQTTKDNYAPRPQQRDDTLRMKYTYVLPSVENICKTIHVSEATDKHANGILFRNALTSRSKIQMLQT